MILLDTEVLIDRERYAFDAGQSYAASIMSRAEFELGVQSARDAWTRASRVQRLAILDSQFDWLEFDIESTRSYGIVAAGAIPPGGAKRALRPCRTVRRLPRPGTGIRPSRDVHLSRRS